VSEAIKLEKTDSILILASDGLWDVMSATEATEVVSDFVTAEEMVEELISTALQRPKCTDNITIVVAVL